ncbi:hypothetical protein SAMN05421665_2779 [Yoonia rosea]|uniref:DUF4274 domain-containing protein n=1 Tax=Yoonia rosea TaxID=287098 RepID=A0A1R3XBL2_9RHOB|nr:hypothetical protein [Yoonia rosea]SIT88699.1 hypothetical protein SAMN05421665_2779 [Yoonia rosea]
MYPPHTDTTDHITAQPKLTEKERAVRRLLRSSPQDLWLDTLRRTRGTEHCALVHWMLCQPECDFAVAVHAFYRCNPTDFLDNPRPLPARPRTHDIFALILRNWETGSYRTHRLKLEAIDADPSIVSQVRQKLMIYSEGTLPFTIPPAFIDPTGGSPVKVPPHLQPNEIREIWSLFSDLGLNVHTSPPGFARRIAQVRWLFARLRQGARQA